MNELETFFKESCQKAQNRRLEWKSRLIQMMLEVALADRRICEDEWYAITEIADNIGAKDECKTQFLKVFEVDPYEMDS